VLLDSSRVINVVEKNILHRMETVSIVNSNKMSDLSRAESSPSHSKVKNSEL
jgi:hypothetical protein